MPREALRVVCYAVDGTGVGHVTRLLAIARWLRRYAAAADQKIEIWFLTSSEADGLVFAEGFAAFKIPSKTIVAETGIDRTAYRALAKQWVWHTLGLLRPDLLLVDTFPRGSFGELLSALDLCRHSAFVYRPVRAEVAERADFQAMLSLYDLVVVPETNAEVVHPPKMAGRVVHVGPVLGRERWELVPREVARERLGIRDGQRCVFVSAGGGGDREAEAQIAAAVRGLAADAELAVVIGTGALYRGRPFPKLTSIPGRAAEWSLAFDAAVCAAGYNTFGEMMFAGAPTVFLPQEKLADDQRARAERAVRAGAAAMVEAHDDVHAAVRHLLARPGAREAARSLVPENGARVAASELLRLVWSPATVDRLEGALDDARLTRAAASGVLEMDALRVGRRLAHGRDDELGAAIDAALVLLRDRDAREVRGVVDAVVRALPVAPVAERERVCRATFEKLGSLASGDGAVARAVVAQGRWGGDGNVDGESLALAMRATT